MNVCLLGDGLTSLTLAKTLINNKIKVFMYHKNDQKPLKQTRTIGISSDNLDFLQKKVIKIKKKKFWEINKIEIYYGQNKEKKMVNFKNSNKKLFSVFKNNDLYKLLDKSLKKINISKKIKYLISFLIAKLLIIINLI